MDGENFDEFMKELGVGMVMRMAAKGVKPRLVIAENGDKWTIRSESTFKTVAYDFKPDVAFDETTPDGRELTVCSTSTLIALTDRCTVIGLLLRLSFISTGINGLVRPLIKMGKSQL